MLDIGPLCNEKFGDLAVFVGRCLHQRGLPVQGGCVDTRAFFQQQADDLQPSLSGREEQGGAPPPVHGVRVHAFFQQGLQLSQISLARRQHHLPRIRAGLGMGRIRHDEKGGQQDDSQNPA